MKRIVFITGATSGIGKASAEKFAANGDLLIINGRRKERLDELKKSELHNLVLKFDEGLQTKIVSGGESMSLGEKQLLAFIRAVLRKPEILILDEATANIDTVTEKLLEDILQKLPVSTTKVIIAHGLNTIENADEIFFINSGEVTAAGSFDKALKLLLEEKRES